MDAICSECENEAANFCSNCTPPKYLCDIHSQNHSQNNKGHTLETAFKIIDNQKQKLLKHIYSKIARDINAQIAEYTRQANYMLESINKSISSLIQLSHELAREFSLSIESSLSYRIISAGALDYYSNFRLKNTKLAKVANKMAENIEKKQSKIADFWNKMIGEAKKFNVNNRVPVESRRSSIDFPKAATIQFNRRSLIDFREKFSVIEDEHATLPTIFKCECLSNYMRIQDNLIKNESKRNKKKCQKCLNLEKCNYCNLWCDKNQVKSSICLDCRNEDICLKCKKVMEKCFVCQDKKICFMCFNFIYCFDCRKYYPLSSLKEYNLQEYAFRDKCLYHLDPVECNTCFGVIPKTDSENGTCLKCLDKGKCICMRTENLSFLSVHRKCRKCAGYSLCNKCEDLERVEFLQENNGFCNGCLGKELCKKCKKKPLEDKNGMCHECAEELLMISIVTKFSN